MFREILILISLASLFGCGTQDYGETVAKTAAAKELGWKEAALKAKETPATLIPPQSGSKANKDCPESTLCIRGSYLGPWQWRDLASRFPGHITTKESENEYRIMIASADHVLIETDIFEHEGGILYLCGKSNTIAASIFAGSAEFNSSGESCDRKDGGTISLIAYEISGDPRIVTDGKNGANGENGKAPSGEERALSGNTKSAKLSFDLKTIKGRWPITKGASDGAGEKSADEPLTHLRQLAQMGIYSEDILETHLNTNCQGCDKAADRWYKSKNAGCFIYFQNEGLFDRATAKIDNSAGLNGKNADPAKIWKAGNGEDGGNAGAIKVLSSKSTSAPHGELSFLAGKPGAGGVGAYQLPGLGVEAELESLFHRNSEKHWVGCLIKKNGKLTEVHDWKAPTSRTLDLHFAIGGPTSYDRLGGSSGKLNAPKGSDGKGLSKEIIDGLTGVAGKDGKSEAPNLRFETDPDFANAFEEACSNCSPLKILGPLGAN